MSDIDENAFNELIIKEFRENAGRVGGQFEHVRLALVHTIGAKSGARRVNPLECMVDGDRYVVIASYAGSTTHPDWYHNMLANPLVTVEYGAEKFEATARMAEEPERSELYARMEAISPDFIGYKKMSGRVIPVVQLERVP